MSDPSSRFPGAESIHLTDRPWYARVVLVTALAVTAFGSLVLQTAVDRTDDERFATAVATAEERVRLRITGCGAMLQGTAGLFAGGAGIDQAAFAAYTEHIALPVDYPGILALGWSAPVPTGSGSTLLARLAGQDYPPPPPRPDAALGHEPAAVLLLTPADVRQSGTTGFPPAIEAGGPLVLRPGSGPAPGEGFLVFVPVFSHADPRKFLGYVYASCRSADLFAVAPAAAADPPLRLRIRDGESGGMLYDDVVGRDGRRTAHRRLTVLGRNWDVDFRTSAAFDQLSTRHLVPVFAVTGVVVGLVLFLLARSQVRTVAVNAALHRRTQAAAREAALSLDINRRLASTLEPQTVAQAVIDAGCELTAADLGAFLTVGGEHQELAVYASCGSSAGRFTTRGLPWLKGLFAPDTASVQVTRVDDLRHGPAEDRARTESALADQPIPILSYLAVAVRSRLGEVLGGLLFVHPQANHFTADHERLLLGLAAQAAIAFDHARLFTAERDARHISAQRADDLAQANVELQQFIYVSSHDLQEPLRTITQYLGLIERRYGTGLDERARRYIAYAADSATRMHTLLNDLLTYSRLGHEAERSPVDLGELVDEVVRDLGVAITEAGEHLSVGTLPIIRCDRAKVRSLFQNLIGNALKFTGLKHPRITVTAQPGPAGMWTLAIADNGIGIAAEHREAVFEVFHRLHEREAFPGTGIGLAICRRVVDQHGGRIWVEDNPDGGTVFRFTLPDADSTVVPIPVHGGSTATAPVVTPTITPV